MPDTVVHVASRKGLFTGRVDGANGWRFGPPAFLGEPVSAVLADPRDGALYAALRLGHFGVKLHRSDDGGATWTELPAPAFPPDPAAGEKAPVVDMVWALAAGGAAEPGVIWAGTLPAALFRSEDRGATWTRIESLWNVPERSEWCGGGYDHPGLHSILVDPRDHRRLTIGISCGGVWLSEDSGATWRLGGSGLRADYMPPGRTDDRAIQDPHRLAHCLAVPDVIWCQHHNGIFRSTDRGETFAAIPPPAPSGFGFAVAAHPHDPQTAWFVPGVKDECRVPVGGRLVVTRTRDGAQSFEALGEGLPEAGAYDLIYRHALDVDATGTRLAMGSTTGNLWIGEAGGARWTLVSTHLPPIAQVAFG
jgi:hypothetical protein